MQQPAHSSVDRLHDGCFASARPSDILADCRQSSKASLGPRIEALPDVIPTSTKLCGNGV